MQKSAIPIKAPSRLLNDSVRNEHVESSHIHLFKRLVADYKKRYLLKPDLSVPAGNITYTST